MKKYLWVVIGLNILFSTSLDAQCKRGEELRITNDVETKVVDCREAMRLMYNDGWYPYSIEYEREDRCPQLSSSAAEYYRSSNWELSASSYSEMMNLRCDEWDPDWVNPNDVYLYWAIALEYLGKFDESEKVLIEGPQKHPRASVAISIAKYSN